MSDALMPTYARAELAFERGHGPYLFDAEGRRYLDFAAGIAVNSLGHAHPHLVAALSGQAEKLWHCSNLYRIPEGERLAERLCAASFAERVFFCNSGAEALECSFKTVRRYHDERGEPDRYRIVTLTGAFHGRTLATLSAAANPKHLAGFMPAVEGFDQVAFDNMNELRAAITPETAAVLIEPVQGEGGIRVASPDYLKALRQVCDEYGLLLVFDEVQCGVGRTGRFFAHEAAGVAPDVMAVAKGLGGGFPVGRLPDHRGGRRLHDRRQPRQHLRRQSAGHGGRQRRAGRGAGRRLPAAGRGDCRPPARTPGGPGGAPSRRPGGRAWRRVCCSACAAGWPIPRCSTPFAPRAFWPSPPGTMSCAWRRR